MWRRKLLLAIIAPVGSSVCLALPDSKALIADTSIPHNEVASSVSEANNFCASAIIAITWAIGSLPK